MIRVCVFRCVASVCLCLPAAIAAGQSQTVESIERLPVPSAAEQARVNKIVQELFAPDAADTNEARLKLVSELVRQAKDTRGDPASRYVLWQTSRKLATAARDFALACQVVDMLAAEFQVDGFAIKLEVLEGVTIPTRETEANKLLIKTALSVADDALAAGKYEAAEGLGDLALKTARKLRDGDLVKQIVEFTKAVRSRADLERAGRAALDKLKTAASDPTANRTAGRYLCLLCGDWTRGLPLLAKSKDAGLKKLAGDDLARPESAGGQKALGDAWWKQAEQEQAPWKAGALARAKYWYTQAVPKLSGFSQTAVEKRLENLADIETTAIPRPKFASTEDTATSDTPAAGKVIDLLPLIDPEKHAIAGEWKREGTTIRAVAGTDRKHGRIRIPVVPQGDYELTLQFTKKGGYLLIALPVGNTSVILLPGYGKGSAIGCVEGQPPYSKRNPTVTDIQPELSRPQSMRIQVQLKGADAAIQVELNGKPMIDYTGPMAKMHPLEAQAIPSPISLGLGSHHSEAIYHRVQLKMRTGKAVPLSSAEQ